MQNIPVSPQRRMSDKLAVESIGAQRTARPTNASVRHTILDVAMICPFAVNRRLLFSDANLDHWALDTNDR
jgi:hypothetical protein